MHYFTQDFIFGQKTVNENVYDDLVKKGFFLMLFTITPPLFISCVSFSSLY